MADCRDRSATAPRSPRRSPPGRTRLARVRDTGQPGQAPASALTMIPSGETARLESGNRPHTVPWRSFSSDEGPADEAMLPFLVFEDFDLAPGANRPGCTRLCAGSRPRADGTVRGNGSRQSRRVCGRLAVGGDAGDAAVLPGSLREVIRPLPGTVIDTQDLQLIAADPVGSDVGGPGDGQLARAGDAAGPADVRGVLEVRDAAA